MKKAFRTKLLVGVLLISFFVFIFNKLIYPAYARDHEGHDEIGTGWDGDSNLPTAGKYYLKKDVTITSTWKPIGDVKLCLNGHGIKMTGVGNVIEVCGGQSLYIYDCTDVLHKYSFDDTGLAIVDDSLTENYLTFTGGYITGGNGSENGGGIYLPGGAYDASTTCLYMDGGNIIGNSTLGHGGGIYYGWVSKRNSIIDLKNVSIIGNVAELSAGGIYHGANNNYLSLENTKVMNNVSGNKPAGIDADSQLKVKGNVYVYDNKLKSGEEVDISIYHDSQDDRLIVTGELSDESKIGYFNIRRELIYDYYKYNRKKNPNDIFISNTYQSLTKKGDNLYTRGIDDEAIYYDENPHSLIMAESLANYDHEIKYGIESGNYNLDEAPQYTGLGEYTTYYRLKINDEMEYEGKQKIIIKKPLPLLPTVIENLKYTGEAQELLSVPENPGATFEYKIKDGYWTDAIPKGLDINDYEIEIRVYADSEHSDYEFNLTASISSPDKTELKNALTNAKAVFEEVKEYGVISLLLAAEIIVAQTIENTEKVTVEKVSGTIENLNEALEEAKHNKKIVDDEIALINEIGDVSYTEEVKTKIDEARLGYDGLLEAYKALVTNYTTLTNAEDTYFLLKADNDAAGEVFALINAIGDVAYESKSNIDSARLAYDLLTDSQKVLVTNYEVLTNAEATYQQILLDKEVAKTVEEKINAIGLVLYDDESKERIDEARESFDSLSDSQKILVENYEALTNAEARYQELTNDNNLASEVFRKINEIDTVTLESKDKLDEVRLAYDSLTDNQKSLVLNLSTLENAEARYSEIISNKEKAALFDLMVDELGTVSYTAEFKEKINDAKASYNKLNKEQKIFVTKYEDLQAKEKQYENIGSVYRMINAISEVSYNSISKTEIANAREAYNNLTEEEKALVSNYDKLASSEATYNSLKGEQTSKLLVTIIFIVAIIIIVIVGGLYILLFFVFNSFAVINSKQVRVFKLSKTDNQYKLLKMNFRVIYVDEENFRKK